MKKDSKLVFSILGAVDVFTESWHTDLPYGASRAGTLLLHIVIILCWKDDTSNVLKLLILKKWLHQGKFTE